MTFAMDLTPLIKKPELDILEFTQAFIQRLSDDITARFERTGGQTNTGNQ